MAEWIISEAALEDNARLLRRTADACGASIILALKGFATTACLPLIGRYADGCCASGLWEALLAHRHMGGQVCVYSPAYRDEELTELLGFAHHIDFNSLTQWRRFREQALAHPRAKSGELLFGLRINPEYSTGHTALYDPCAPGSRLGIPAAQLAGADLEGISGLHFHTLCEQGAEDLAATWKAIEERFGTLLASPAIRYVNMGGGHWITQPGYNRDLLAATVRSARERYGVGVVLEPGEAWCIHTGVLRAQVLDVFESLGTMHAIVDVSASAHMPDVLEMPYRPEVFQVLGEHAPAPARPAAGTDGAAAELAAPAGPAVQLPGERYARAGDPGRLPYTYRLGAPTCLAGDVIGDYAFASPLAPGDTLVFDDMAHYTLVKTTFFNGVPHPPVSVQEKGGALRRVKEWGYRDFESRLGGGKPL